MPYQLYSLRLTALIQIVVGSELPVPYAENGIIVLDYFFRSRLGYSRDIDPFVGYMRYLLITQPGLKLIKLIRLKK